MSSTTFNVREGNVTTKMVRMECCSCGTLFCVSAEFQITRFNDKRSFCCPNGHAQQFSGPTEADKLRAELARKTAAMDQLEQSRRLAWEQVDLVRTLKDEAERSASAAKGQVTKLRNRVAAGVCPCCNRTVKQLAAHMSDVHPEFVKEQGMPVVKTTRRAPVRS